jgi:hypothetical protein
MLSLLNKYAYNVHSQNGEDGLLIEILARLGLYGQGCSFPHVYCVEIGANDGLWMSNTRHLINCGASSLFVESDFALYQQCVENWKNNPRVRVQCCHVDRKNINAFIDNRCDVLSLDTDGGDYEIFKGLQVKPKIVIVEIDSSIPPDVDGFNSDGGASYKTMVELGKEKGYELLCHTGNLVFIAGRFALSFPELGRSDPILNAELYFNRSWLKQEAA